MDAVVADYDGAVVERSIRLEDVLDKRAADLRVDTCAGRKVFIELRIALDNDQRADFAL